MLLAFLAVVPLTLDRVRLLENDRADRIAYAYAEAHTLAKRGLDAQQEIVSVSRALLQVIARAHALNEITLAGDKCGAFLSGISGDVSWIRGFSVAGPNGRITCSTQPNAIGLDVSDRTYFQNAMSSGGFVISDYVMGRSDRGPAIAAALPMKNAAGTIQAVAIAFIDLQWIERLTSTVAHRSHSSVFLIDGTGKILAGDPSASTWLGQQAAAHPLIRQMLAQDEGTASATGTDGMTRIFGFVRLFDTDARLAVGFDAGEILARVDREINIAYVQFAFVILMVLLLAWIASERLIVEPTRLLARTARRFGRGELDVRARQKAWLPEFAPLAGALDDMADQLAERERELRIANRHLEELASIDSLSGLANRRSFDTRLDVEWQRAAKSKRPVGLLMIDVDHFKAFNDSHGHLGGDSCLRVIGDILGTIAREEGGLAARYGGEEFALLMPNTDLERALTIAERVRKTIEDFAIRNDGAPSGSVTVSVGVAALVPDGNHPPSRLIEAADVGLYAAKRSGRNAVRSHVPDVTLVAAD